MLRDFSLILTAIIATATIVLAWDSEYGIPLRQLALVFGGMLLGHIITEALNATGDTDHEEGEQKC